MGLLGSPSMLVAFLLIPWLLGLRVQPSGTLFDEARALDSILQDYAYKAFVRPRTGIAYDGRPPSNLSGIAISVMRLRSGSLRRKGVSSYKEFAIPTGVIVQPYVKRLALVYQNLGNWSTVYYPLSGYDYIAPVVGLLSYSAFNLSATNLLELDLRASGQPISIRFSDVKSIASSSTARCVAFDLHGTMKFSNISSGNVCSTVEQGHFAIVIKSLAPSPAPVPVPHPPLPAKKGEKNLITKIVGSIWGGIGAFTLLLLLALLVRRLKHQTRIQAMERASEAGESMDMASIGNVRVPVARLTRTQPLLET